MQILKEGVDKNGFKTGERNLPMQSHINHKRFTVVITPTSKGLVTTPKITGSGMAYLLPRIIEYINNPKAYKVTE